jgi:dihydrofolate reductase
MDSLPVRMIDRATLAATTSCGSMNGTDFYRTLDQMPQLPIQSVSASFSLTRSTRRARWCQVATQRSRSTSGAVIHGGVPIYVPSHRPPGPVGANYPLVTFVNDGIVSAIARAKEASGDRDVLVHGAYTAQTALEAGALDEMQIHQIPVLFGSGRRLFELLPERVELEIVRVIDTPAATHIRYRVVH